MQPNINALLAMREQLVVEIRRIMALEMAAHTRGTNMPGLLDHLTQSRVSLQAAWETITTALGATDPGVPETPETIPASIYTPPRTGEDQ